MNGQRSMDTRSQEEEEFSDYVSELFSPGEAPQLIFGECTEGMVWGETCHPEADPVQTSRGGVPSPEAMGQGSALFGRTQEACLFKERGRARFGELRGDTTHTCWALMSRQHSNSPERKRCPLDPPSQDFHAATEKLLAFRDREGVLLDLD